MYTATAELVEAQILANEGGLFNGTDATLRRRWRAYDQQAMNMIWNDRFWPFRTSTVILTPSHFEDDVDAYALPANFATFEGLVGNSVYRTDRRAPALRMEGLDIFLHFESQGPVSVGQPTIWALDYFQGAPRIRVHPKPAVLVDEFDEYTYPAWPSLTVHFQIRSPRLLYKGEFQNMQVDDHIGINDELHLLPIEWRYLVELGGNWRHSVATANASAGDELALFKVGLDQMRARLVTPIRGITAVMPGRMRPLV